MGTQVVVPDQDCHHLPIFPEIDVRIPSHFSHQPSGLIDDLVRGGAGLGEVESDLRAGADAFGPGGVAVQVGVEVLEDVGQSHAHAPVLVAA